MKFTLGFLLALLLTLAGCNDSSQAEQSGGAGGTSGAGGTAAAAGAGGSAGGGAAGTSSPGGQGGQGRQAVWGGINLSSAEWGSKLPGVYGTDYTYPTHAEVDRYTGLGMRILRIPFAWERLQPSLGSDLDPTELGRLDDVVSYATGKAAHVIVDVHNYARYNGSIIGAGTVTAANLADFWAKMSAHYAGNALVIFGLMNEPHDIDVQSWLAAANGAIAAIRATGATNLILVPGTNWTGAATWTSSNAAMIGVVDSGNNYAYEVHQYLDSDSSGSHTTCVSATVGTDRITPFMTWLQSNAQRGFLGEFGAGASADTESQDQTCATAVDSMLSLIQSRPDLWLGWTYWAGGPWWRNGSSFTITDSATPWQLTLLETHL